jgi:hypothetical protein
MSTTFTAHLGGASLRAGLARLTFVKEPLRARPRAQVVIFLPELPLMTQPVDDEQQKG